MIFRRIGGSLLDDVYEFVYNGTGSDRVLSSSSATNRSSSVDPAAFLWRARPLAWLAVDPVPLYGWVTRRSSWCVRRWRSSTTCIAFCFFSAGSRAVRGGASRLRWRSVDLTGAAPIGSELAMPFMESWPAVVMLRGLAPMPAAPCMYAEEGSGLSDDNLAASAALKLEREEESNAGEAVDEDDEDDEEEDDDEVVEEEVDVEDEEERLPRREEEEEEEVEEEEDAVAVVEGTGEAIAARLGVDLARVLDLEGVAAGAMSWAAEREAEEGEGETEEGEAPIGCVGDCIASGVAMLRSEEADAEAARSDAEAPSGKGLARREAEEREEREEEESFLEERDLEEDLRFSGVGGKVAGQRRSWCSGNLVMSTFWRQLLQTTRQGGSCRGAKP